MQLQLTVMVCRMPLTSKDTQLRYRAMKLFVDVISSISSEVFSNEEGSGVVSCLL